MEEFDNELKEIKNKINEIELSDEFKTRLEAKMNEEFYKQEEAKEVKTNVFKFNSISKRLATIAACFVFLISGCVTFADEIELWVVKVFSNTDKQIEMAIENGNYRKIDMDYVENNGVAIKVDYLIVEEDALCIAFNVKTEEEYDDVFFECMNIKCSNQNNIFFLQYNSDYRLYRSKINLKEHSLIYKIKNTNIINKNETFNIEIKGVNLNKNNEYMNIEKKWMIFFGI